MYVPERAAMHKKEHTSTHHFGRKWSEKLSHFENLKSYNAILYMINDTPRGKGFGYIGPTTIWIKSILYYIHVKMAMNDVDYKYRIYDDVPWQEGGRVTHHCMLL